MRSGENTPQMSFDLDRQADDRQMQPNDVLSRRIMVRQNSDSGFSGYVKKFDQISNRKRVSIHSYLESSKTFKHDIIVYGSQ